MLSDEEKKSLKRMQLFARSSDLSVVTAKDMKIVVTLVEKQSKEIEEMKKQIDLDNECVIALNSKIMDLKKLDKCNSQLIANMSTRHFNDREKIRKYESLVDKIKAKIEEYEQNVKDFEEYWSKDPRKFKKEKSVDYYKLEALKELLEKE